MNKFTLEKREMIIPGRVIALLLIFALGFAQNLKAQMSDLTFFGRINLDYPGLEQVREAIEEGDYEAARMAYVAFQRTRPYPKYPFSTKIPTSYPSQKREPSDSRAENVLRHTFTIEDFTYQFPGEIDWHFNPTDSEENPDYEGLYKREWTVVLNSLSCFRDLANAFEETGNPIYLEKLDELVNHWITNAPVQYPTTPEEFWRSSWRTLEAGLRTGGSWPIAWGKSVKLKEIHDSTIIRWLKSWMQHGDYLEEYTGSLNWLTTESQGLFTIGTLFPEFRDAADWRELAIQRLSEHMEIGFYPDGAHAELSPEYHRIAAESYAEVVILARLNEIAIDEGFLSKIEKAVDYLARITMPDRNPPRLNDSGIKEYLPKVLNRWGLEIFPQRTDFQWFASEGAQGSPPDYLSTLLPWAGQAVMRENWSREANYLLFEYGPYGQGSHQHEDKLGVHISNYGDLFVFEAGRENYGDTPLRNYCLSSQGHSVLTIDRLGQNRQAFERELARADQPYDVVWTTTKEFDYASAAYGAHPLERYGPNQRDLGKWRRHVWFLKPDLFVIADVVTPADEDLHTYHSHFHLNAQEAFINEASSQITVTEAGRSAFSLTPLPDEALTTEIFTGQMTPDILGWELFEVQPDRAIPTVRFQKQGRGLVDFAYTFQSAPEGNSPPASFVKRKETSEKLLVYEVGNGNQLQLTYTILLSVGGADTIEWNGEKYPAKSILITDWNCTLYDLQTGAVLGSVSDCSPCPAPGTPCDDNDACTTGDQYDDFCNCVGTVSDRDGDSVPDGCDDCDGNLAGTPCDDGDACTENDVYDASCNCAGTLADSDGDGVCDAEDLCPGSDDTADEDGDGIPDGCDDCDGNLAGTPCDDGDACTENDVYDASCNCAGTLADSDGDGVCDAEDLCPGSDDTADEDGDGIPDGCDDCDGNLAGTPCDDGDACTENDVYDASCHCAGTLADSDGDGVCDAEDLCPGSDDTADEDGDGIPDGCDDCDDKLAGTPCDDGDACTENDVYDASCNCAGTLADEDGDGVCDAEDLCPGSDDTADEDGDGIPDGCDDCNDQLAGTPCDDGDACTENDVYDASCHCAGTLADEDGDGVCDAEDLCPGFDDTVDGDGDGVPDGCDDCDGNLVGTPCDDGDPSTSNDVYDADCNCGGAGGPFDYCFSYGESTASEWIEAVVINGVRYQSGNNQGYMDLTGNPVELAAGTSLPLELHLGTEDLTTLKYWRVWIDFNRNGILGDTGEMVYEDYSRTEAHFFEVQIPPGLEGNTRMRVSMQWAEYPEACDTVEWGEVEDYTLSITASPCPVAGTACDDGDPATTNDAEDGDCNCVGERTYCESYGEVTEYEWIEAVQINNTAFASGNDGGYRLHSNAVYVPPGTSVPLALHLGATSETIIHYWRVWIDFDQDGAFNDDDEMVYETDLAQNVHHTQIAIPPGLSGSSRMRVSLQWGAYAAPCDLVGWGEVEDFILSFDAPQALVSPPAAGPQLWLQGEPRNVLAEPAIRIFPNPARHRFFVDYVDLPVGTAWFSLRNSFGQRIAFWEWHNEHPDGIREIRLPPGLSNGGYYLTLQWGKSRISRFLVLE